MEKNLRHFLVELIQHYSNQENIQYICYDGTARPNIVEHDPHFIMKSKTTLEYIGQWFIEYVTEKENIHCYTLFKALIKEAAGLWVNPTVDELRTFNEQNNREREAFLENYISHEQEWMEDAKKRLEEAINENGYSLIQGKELIERLVKAYDSSKRKDKSFIDWVKPIEIASIDNEADYILDREVFQEPLKVTEHMLLEYENHGFRVLPSVLPYYFENVVVTQRGLETKKFSKDQQLDVYFYQEIIDYLQENEHETSETTFQKLFEQSVNPFLPFVEIVIDGFTECYMNIQRLETEKDILAFINRAYTAEGSDQEAKSFNRKQIVYQLASCSLLQGSSVSYLDEDRSDNKWDDRNYSFR